MKKGRPKAQANDRRSYGPLGDLIRNHRLQKGFGLLDVAKACNCSVQFISNIEHGRAPLPWDKAEKLSKFLGVSLTELKSANLAIRSDLKSFFKGKGAAKTKSADQNTVSIIGMAIEDVKLRDILQKFSSADLATKKKFYTLAARFF